MNNRIKTIIITITAIALAFGLLVSCDGNVITTRNNKLAYTEVLETGGGFVYKGQSYDLLSDILNVIKQEGSQEEPIRVTGNVSMRPVTIPEGMTISLDLGGNEIRFFDVKDSAVKASGEGTVLNLSNGALSLAKEDAELAVIEADGAEAVNLSALEIKADGQTALDLNGVKDTKLEKNVSVSGAVIVKGGEDSTRLTIANELSDVRMNGATLVVAENGKAVITENLPDHSDNSYVVSPNAALIDHTGTIEPEDIHTGVCYIVRERTYYYGSLSEAVQSLGEGDAGATITFFADDENAADIELNIPVTIDLAGHSVTAANNITLADGIDLTIENSSTTTSYFTGTVTSAEGGTSSLSVEGDVVMNNEINVTGSLTGEGATFKDDITASGNINLTGSKFDSGTETAPNVTSSNGNISMTNVSGTIGEVAAPHVSISNPQSGSHINSLNTNGLDVTDSSNNLTVDAVDLEGNGTSTINGGKYGDFDYNGTAGGSLTVNGGIFTDFDKTGAGTSTLNGGTFTVKGTSVNPNLAKIDTYLNMTGSNANITINYVPETNNKIELSSNSYSFGQNMGSNAQATISFGSSVDSQNKLTSGLVIDGGATVGFTFGNNVSFTGNLFVELGGTLTSNKDLQTTNCNVKRRYTDNTVSSYVSEEGSYTYKAQIVVTFNSNGGTGTMGKQGVAYNAATALNANSFTRSGYNFSKWNTNSSGTGTNYGNQASVTLTADLTLYAVWYQPTVTFNNNGGTGSMSNQTVSYNVATKLNKSTFAKEGYNFIGWNTDSTAEAAQYDDEGNVTLTSDTTLYAIWQTADSLSSAVEVKAGEAIWATCKLYQNDNSWTEIGSPAGTDGTYSYVNTTGSSVYVKGIVHPGSSKKENYGIMIHRTVAGLTDYNYYKDYVEEKIGVGTVAAMATLHGTNIYWFSNGLGSGSYYYQKNGDVWEWSTYQEGIYDSPTIGRRVNGEFAP